MLFRSICLSLFVFCSLSVFAQAKAKKCFKLPAQLEEVSGLYIASMDSLWWHNDSGAGPLVYRTNGRGDIQEQIDLSPAQAYDWEDMTADAQGRIYIGDFGDNRFVRKQLNIYRYTPQSQQLDSISYTYPNDESYNVEAFFWHQDSLHLFTKSVIQSADLPTYHFVLPAKAGQHTASLRDSFYLKKRVVTAAAIHAASGRVVLLAYYYKKHLGFIPYSVANIFCFSDYPQGHFLKGKMRKRKISGLVATQFESIDFINQDQLWVASEQTAFVKPKVKRVKWRIFKKNMKK